jgi:hypothetical protein
MVQPPTMMTPFLPNSAVLTCHPETHTPAVEGIEARVGWTQDNALALAYVLKGNLLRLQIPPSRRPRRVDYLWQHTCFEAFVSVKGKPEEYYEFNFAPSAEWAAYHFQRHRDGTPLADDIPAPKIRVHNVADRLDLDAVVRLDRLPTLPPRARLRLALSAVIEDKSGMLSYWALKHPPGKPDFHHPDAFTLDLEPPGVNVIDDPD